LSPCPVGLIVGLPRASVWLFGSKREAPNYEGFYTFAEHVL